MNIIFAVSDNLDAAIDELAPGLDITWWVGHSMVPMPPNGSLQFVPLLVISAPNPNLGDPSVTAQVPVDIRQLRDPERAKAIMRKALGGLHSLLDEIVAENRAKINRFILPPNAGV